MLSLHLFDLPSVRLALVLASRWWALSWCRTAAEDPDSTGKGRYGWQLSVSARKTCEESIFNKGKLALAHGCRGFNPWSLGHRGGLIWLRCILVGAHGIRAAYSTTARK